MKKPSPELEPLDSRLQTILDGTVDGIVMINEAREILLFNQAAERLFRYKAKDVLGKNVHLLMPEPFHSEHDGYVENYLASGEKKIIGIGREVMGRKKCGTVFPLYLSVSETVFSGSRIFVGILHDISAKKRKDRELEAAREAAEAASRAKSDFLANMGHELRTPMNAILGLSDALLADTLSPEQRTKIEQIQSAAGTLLALINDILDFSRIECGDCLLTETEFSPAELLEELRHQMQPLAENKGLSLTCRLGDATPPVLIGDPDRLKQVLVNLLDNAIKFTQTGGVRLDVARLEGDLEKNAPEADLLFTIRDSGSGMNAGQLATIFEPFAQVDASRARRHGGTGLGLSIVKKLVELMGGRVEVESQPGKGSVFSFILRCRIVTVKKERGSPKKEALSLAELPDINYRLAQKHCGDDPAVFERTLAELLACYPDLHPIAEPLSRLDFAEVRKHAASLQQMAGRLGAEGLERECRSLEQALAASPSMAKMELLVAALARQLAMIFDAVAGGTRALPDLPFLDSAAALARLNQDEAFYQELLADFCREYRDTAEELRRMVLARRFDEAKRMVFALKGTAVSVGAQEVQRAALRLELALAAAPAPETLDRLLKSVGSELFNLTEAAGKLSAATSSAAKAPELDPEQAEQLAALDRLLKRKDMAALALFDQIKKSLPASPAARALAEMDRPIRRLDFKKAREQLHALLSTLGLSPEL